MLSKYSFNKGIDNLLTEYESKGFKMSKERAETWYKHMQRMSNEEFNEKIDYVIINNTYSPSLADVLKAISKTEHDRRRTELEDMIII